MRLLHFDPLDTNGTPLEIKLAGVLARVNLEETSDTRAFMDALTSQLSDMAARIMNIHAYPDEKNHLASIPIVVSQGCPFS